MGKEIRTWLAEGKGVLYRSVIGNEAIDKMLDWKGHVLTAQ
jgi:hypothetical protein